MRYRRCSSSCSRYVAMKSCSAISRCRAILAMSSSVTMGWRVRQQLAHLGTVHNAERLLMQLQGDPVHLARWNSLFHSPQEPIVLVIVVLGVFLPVSDEGLVGSLVVILSFDMADSGGSRF